MANDTFLTFVQKDRTSDSLVKILQTLIPQMAKRSKTSTLNFINMMKEVKINQNSVIEMQGENP